MARQIIIGREGNQPFALVDPKVSKAHATLIVNDNGTMQLIDNSSTNGTFIYNRGIFVRLCANDRYDVTPDTMIRLGPETQFHVRRLLGQASPKTKLGGVPAQNTQGGVHGQQAQQRPAPPKKRVDISHLRKISNVYNQQKMKIESKSSMINSLRGLTILVTMGAGTVASYFTTKNDTDAEEGKMIGIFCLVGAAILMIIFLLVINNFNKKLMKKRMTNDHNYAVKYVCPECHVSFRGKIYENILAERCCPKCKTEYYDKNQE